MLQISNSSYQTLAGDSFDGSGRDFHAEMTESDVYLCIVADLNNVSASVRFRQSTDNHVRVSNSLHLITRTYMRPIKWMFLAIQLRRKLRSKLQLITFATAR